MKAHSLHQRSFTHITSTPRYPQSNGKIETTMKSMNKIIRSSWNGRHLDKDKLCCALLQYQNTPSHKDSLFLAQKLYSRPVQDMLLVHHRSFSDEWQQSAKKAEKAATHCREKAETTYNAHACNLDP